MGDMFINDSMNKIALSNKLEKIKNKQCLYNIIKMIRKECDNGYVSDSKYTYIFLNHLSNKLNEDISDYIKSLE